MNLVLFTEGELTEDRLVLTDRRALHIQQILRLQAGDLVRVGMINGNRGTGRVVAMSGNAVELQVNLDQVPLSAPSLTLILALPRPIMLQRILKQATVLGVHSFYLIRSRKVEKSFFHSPVLHPAKIEALLREGLEQAMDTHLPEVHIHHRFKPFVEDIVPGLIGNRIVAHPETSGNLADVVEGAGLEEKCILAVGPEGGWSDYEIDCFEAQGFRSFSMGSRILHVDTAVVALLAQLQLLYDLRKR